MRTATNMSAAVALLLFKLAAVTLAVGAAGPRAHAAGGGGNTNGAPNSATAREATTSMKVANFDDALSTALELRGATGAALCDRRDPVARRILNEYGAVFVAGGEVLPPPVCIFGGRPRSRPSRRRRGSRGR